MHINSISLNNFRNYINETVYLKEGLNVLIGQNAQGKTNLLESVLFSSICKSLRAIKEKELINFNLAAPAPQQFAKIKIDLVKNYGKVNLDLIIQRVGKKILKINSTPVLKVSELLGILTTVYFSPDELALVKEAPDNRRRFLDISISQTSKHYFNSLLKYQKILAHRNKLLKDARSLEEISASLEIFTTQLINEGCYIICERNKFLKKLSPLFNEKSLELSKNKEAADLTYIGIHSEDILEIKEILKKEMQKTLEKDFKMKFTHIGPHRDDFKITLNNIDIRLYGSQGQHRSSTLCLKLAEMEIIKEQTGEYPILLLDDVLSELDTERQETLLKMCDKTQIILTCTSFNFKNFQYANIINICDGHIVSL